MEYKISTNLKLLILCWLTIQSTVHALLIKYTRREQQPPVQLYLPSVAVFLMELFKCAFSAIMILHAEGLSGFIGILKKYMLHNLRDVARILLPTLMYTIQNNLVYIGLQYLDAASFMISYQLKIIFAAIFSMLILGRKITLVQWIAIVQLFIGVGMIGSQRINTHKEMEYGTQNDIKGFFSVIVAAFISGLAGVLLEKIFKDEPKVSLWIRNLQMSIVSIPSSYLAIFVNDKIPHKFGILNGFTPIVWLTVIWYSIGGITVAICLRYTDNISKDFAIAISILFTTLFSTYFFDFLPNQLYILGALLVVVSTFLFSKSHSILLRKLAMFMKR